MDDFAIQGFRGRLIGSTDKDYDEARALYNGMIDKRPKVIARCTDAADVMAAVNYARENKLLLAIRGGGHNGPGFGSCDGGLVIDPSQMRSATPTSEAPMIRALAVLLFFQCLGETTCFVGNIPVPGPVIGCCFYSLHFDSRSVSGVPSENPPSPFSSICHCCLSRLA